jgi:hypothetical protein
MGIDGTRATPSSELIRCGGNEFVVPDAPIVRPGDSTKLDPSVVGFQDFYKFGAMRQ